MWALWSQMCLLSKHWFVLRMLYDPQKWTMPSLRYCRVAMTVPITALCTGICTSAGFGLVGAPAVAQITPDTTLGNESSQVVPANIRNRGGHRIDGGAIRGDNLFHSFLEFNVEDGRGAYFSNPSDIENILGRVTGTDVSDILGTLGVLGNANLFLLNPNGFVFGENATLDIRGSFVASTADRFDFPDGSQFSAVNPAAAPLLTVALSPGLQYGTNYQGAIANAANLTVDPGQTLSLAADVTTTTGTLTAPGGTIQVLGNQVNLLGGAHLNVSAAQGGGDIFVGGNLRGLGPLPNAQQTAVAPGVVLQADALTAGNGGNIVVWADGLTQFYGTVSARGGMQVGNGGFAEVSGKQNLVFAGQANLSAPQGLLGTLLLDPENITIVNGDGGLNDIELIDNNEIQAEDSPGETFSISEETLEGLARDANIVLEATNNITLNDLADDELDLSGPDGSSLPVVEIGSVTVTADADADGAGSFITLDTNDTIVLAGRDITITGAIITAGTINSDGGDIALSASDAITLATINSAGGNVDLVAGSDITPGSISSEGGDISVDAGNRIVLNGSEINSGDSADISFTGFSGDIDLIAGSDITLTNAIVTSDGSGVDVGESGDAGDITVRTTNGSISLQASEISSSALSGGFAGDIDLEAGDRIDIRNGSTVLSDAEEGFTDDAGGAGFITIDAMNDVTVASGSRISAESIGGADNSTSGDISITSEQGSILLNRAAISTVAEGSGFAGNIDLEAGDRISIRNQSTLLSNAGDSFSGNSEGGAGRIRVRSENDIILGNGSTISAETVNDGGSAATDNNGEIILRSLSGSIVLRQNAQLTTNVDGSGFAGDILLRAGNDVILRNSSITSDLDTGFVDGVDSDGGAGFIELRARNDVFLDGTADGIDTTISATSFNGSTSGDAGEIKLEARQGSIFLSNAAEVITSVEGNGFAGDITFSASNGGISISESSILSDFQGSSFAGSDEGGAGFIQFSARDNIMLAGSATESRSDGTSRDLRAISASTFGNPGDSGNTGNIFLSSSTGSVTVSDARVIATASGDEAEAGTIDIQSNTGDISIDNNSRIRTDAEGNNPVGGSISFRTNGSEGQVTVNNSQVSSIANDTDTTTGAPTATGGEVFIQAGSRIFVLNNARILSDANGLAGDIDMDASESILIRSSTVSSEGTNGNIVIGGETPPATIEIVNSTLSTANTDTPTGDSGAITITGNVSILLDASEISSEALDIDDDSTRLQVQAEDNTTDFGNGGDITLTLPLTEGVLVLLNSSQILTDAGAVPTGRSGGNGGNIAVAADVVVAETLGNSDITANSVNNNGGTITITASTGIFGLIERTREDLVELLGTDVEGDLDPRQVPTSDITAVSQTGAGLSGEIVLNTPDVDPSQGNIELPSAFEDTPTLASVCSARLDAESGRRSEFVFTGRGGLPIDPDDPINGSRPMTPWVERDLPGNEDSREENFSLHPSPNGLSPNTSMAIVEAQGWQTNQLGQTVLMAQVAAQSTSSQPSILSANCVSNSEVQHSDS